MARKPNYDFEKRKKEMDRKAKQDAKREEKARRKGEGLTDDDLEGLGIIVNRGTDEGSGGAAGGAEGGDAAPGTGEERPSA